MTATAISTREQILTDIQNSLKQGKKERLPVLRGLLTEIVVEEKKGTHRGALLGDEEVLNVIIREKKKYEEAAEFAKQAHRDDLRSMNLLSIDILNEYLPSQLSNADVDQMIRTLILQLNATDITSLGTVMRVLSPLTKGRYDGKKASEHVRVLLTSLSEGTLWTT